MAQTTKAKAKANGKKTNGTAAAHATLPPRRKKIATVEAPKDPDPVPRLARKRAETALAPSDYSVEQALLTELKPHPRNYKHHPDDQLAHIVESLRENGIFKNIVVTADGTILAGHGVVEAARRIGYERIPVRRLELDPNSARALKILALDNELGRFAETDDRMLTELLKQVKDEDMVGLLGTGYDDKMLAALAMVTRPASEIQDINEAAEWVGMPDYEPGGAQIKVVITFKSEKDRKEFIDVQKMKIAKIAGLTWSTRWPWTENEDASSVRFETE